MTSEQDASYSEAYVWIWLPDAASDEAQSTRAERSKFFGGHFLNASVFTT